MTRGLTGTFQTNMGIAHLEDLPLGEFIHVVKNIGSMHASEKLDGANLWMGLDEQGKLFTSRQGKRKGAKNFYSEAEYPYFAAYNGFRAAQAAFEEKIEDVKRIMQPGQTVECEVLFGRQPNAVTYGADDKSYIAFLRGVDGTPDIVADQLSTSLGGQSVTVRVKIVDTTDGEDLELVDTDVTYQFTGAQQIPTEKLKDVDLNKQVEELEKFLEAPAGLESHPELTNWQLITNSLGTIPIDVRPQAKELKADIMARVMTDFKLPIKKDLLLNYVAKIKPQLGAADVTTDEDVGIEGVVLRDPTNGDMIKLVDKDTFTTINTFNHSVRNQISGVVRTLDSTAPLESRGGILGNMKIQIADLLGEPDLARGGPGKKLMDKARGKDAVETVKRFAANLDIEDFQGTKRKVLALIAQAAKEIHELLVDFKAHVGDFQLKLKNGKVIGISPEIQKRTLLVFAEARRNVSDQFNKVKACKTPAQLIAVLYGHYATALFSDVNDDTPSEVQESHLIREFEEMLTEKKNDTDKGRYKGKQAKTLLDYYFATVFMSVLFFKADDAVGIKMLRDKVHYMMDAWSPQMSQLNFWGYPIWHASQPVVKKLVGPKATSQIFKITRQIPLTKWRSLHKDLSFGKDKSFDWTEHKHVLQLLQQFDGMKTDRINTLMDGVFKFDKLDHDDKVKLLDKLHTYVAMTLPNSPLFTRFKILQKAIKREDDDDEKDDDTVKEMRLFNTINALVEDETSDAANAQAAGPQVDMVNLATRSADVTDKTSAPTVNKNRHVVKRRRNPAVKKAKFPKPEDSTV